MSPNALEVASVQRLLLHTSVILPARDEEAVVGAVVRALPPVGEVVVVDNGSRDGTARAAREAGATVVAEPTAGYGRACLAGMAHVRARAGQTGVWPEAVVFLDADGSDEPAEIAGLVAPIAWHAADLVVGSRVLGARLGRVERGALLPQARWGNALATRLIALRWGVRFTDLGPFRAVRTNALFSLGMADEAFGWTVEMQVRAVRAGLRCAEVPVSYRRRVGRSKITGTLGGTLRAGHAILGTIARHALARRPRP